MRRKQPAQVCLNPCFNGILKYEDYDNKEF